MSLKNAINASIDENKMMIQNNKCESLLNNDQKHWFSLLLKSNANNILEEHFKQNPIEYDIIQFILKNEDNFGLLWNMHFDKLKENLNLMVDQDISQHFFHVLFKLRQILYDNYVVNNVLYGKEISSLSLERFSLPVEYEEYHTLEKDEDLIKKMKDVDVKPMKDFIELYNEKVCFFFYEKIYITLTSYSN